MANEMQITIVLRKTVADRAAAIVAINTVENALDPYPDVKISATVNEVIDLEA